MERILIKMVTLLTAIRVRFFTFKPKLGRGSLGGDSSKTPSILRIPKEI